MISEGNSRFPLDSLIRFTISDSWNRVQKKICSPLCAVMRNKTPHQLCVSISFIERRTRSPYVYLTNSITQSLRFTRMSHSGHVFFVYINLLNAHLDFLFHLLLIWNFGAVSDKSITEECRFLSDGWRLNKLPKWLLWKVTQQKFDWHPHVQCAMNMHNIQNRSVEYLQRTLSIPDFFERLHEFLGLFERSSHHHS